MHAFLVLLASFAFLAPVQAGDNPPPPGLADTLNGSEESATALARCKGYWTWLSDIARTTGQPASADYLKTFANGAQTTALWIHSIKFQVDHPDEPPRTLGSFQPLIDGPADVEKMRMAALFEAQDTQAINQTAELCRALAEASDPILQELRKNLLKPTPAEP